jgi:hypothetical protein
LESLKDVLSFLKERKKYWLAPIIIFLFLLGGLILLGGSSVAGPFIYSLF